MNAMDHSRVPVSRRVSCQHGMQTNCVLTSMNVRRIKFISYINVLGMFSINESQMHAKNSQLVNFTISRSFTASVC